MFNNSGIFGSQKPKRILPNEKDDVTSLTEIMIYLRSSDSKHLAHHISSIDKYFPSCLEINNLYIAPLFIDNQ